VLRTCALAVAVTLAPCGVRAEDRDATPGASRGDDGRAVGLTIGASAVGAATLLGVGYGLFMLLEPAQCVQSDPGGACLRTREPSEAYRLHGAAMLGVGAAMGVATVVLAVLADEAFRALAPPARASLRPWLAADPTAAMAGVVAVW
jgi:hypothetical protein